jgi:predicted RNA-binding protein
MIMLKKLTMNGRIYVFAAGIVALVLVAVGEGEVQTKMTSKEMIAALKPGQWVKVKGTVQSDSVIACNEMRILIGDFLDDDWSVTGAVRKIDQENRKIEILRLPIKINEDAKFESDEDESFAGIADLKAGMFLEIGGTYLKDGIFLAGEVDDKSERLEEEPELKHEIRAEGKVEKVDAANHRFTLMGMAFQITAETKSRSVIK